MPLVGNDSFYAWQGWPTSWFSSRNSEHNFFRLLRLDYSSSEENLRPLRMQKLFIQDSTPRSEIQKLLSYISPPLRSGLYTTLTRNHNCKISFKTPHQGQEFRNYISPRKSGLYTTLTVTETVMVTIIVNIMFNSIVNSNYPTYVNIRPSLSSCPYCLGHGHQYRRVQLYEAVENDMGILAVNLANS